MKESLAPDFITPITAWRFWRIFINSQETKSSLCLGSAVIPQLWPYKEKFQAECFCCGNSLHTANLPESDSLCGIYAYKSSRFALADIQLVTSYYGYYVGTVLGKVKLWGKIQQHQFGYRAQFAYPSSLLMGICGGCQKVFYLESEYFLLRPVLKVFPFKGALLRPFRMLKGSKTKAFSSLIFPGMLLCRKCWGAKETTKAEFVYSFVYSRVLQSLENHYSIKTEKVSLIAQY